jgi:catalase
MSSNATVPSAAEQPRLSGAKLLSRFALIGIIFAAIVGTFAYLGGWLTPHAVTPARLVDAFEFAAGKHPGFRRNHAKGVGVTGFFESNGTGTRLSKAGVFSSGRLPVIGRFSIGGGLPSAPDLPDSVRGLGLQFTLPDGELWRTAMVNLPVFPVRTPEAFYELLIASKPEPNTGQPDPAKMQAFIGSHPEFLPAIKIIKAQAVPSGFENSTFHSLNAFRFINAAGVSTPVRWILTPLQPFEASGPAPADKNYLFDGLIAQIHRQPLRWHLVLIVGQPGDPTNDATAAWPEEREKVDVGTLTLDQIVSDETSPATEINFDPLVLPSGIEPSDDPLLSARSAVYSQGYTRRAGEPKPVFPITPADVRKGE